MQWSEDDSFFELTENFVGDAGVVVKPCAGVHDAVADGVDLGNARLRYGCDDQADGFDGILGFDGGGGLILICGVEAEAGMA